MQVGGAGSMRSDINITPMVDVVLVLLIIFMVLTPVVQMGYLVKIPPKAPANLAPSAMADQIVLTYTKNKEIKINKEVVSPEVFPQRIREILKGNTNKMIFFTAERDVVYDDAMKFLDLARASGAQNIGILVDDVR